MAQSNKNRLQIQAWLHRQKVDEAEACQVLLDRRQRGWKDRYTITQALNALEMKEREGWTPTPPLDNVKMTSEMVNLLKSVQSLAARLASMDFSSAQMHSVSGDLEIVARELTAFEQSATAMLGSAVFFDED